MTIQNILNVFNAKSNWNNLININDKLKNRVALNLSMQSLKIETLTDIKRRNWTKEQYIEFLKEGERKRQRRFFRNDYSFT